MTGASPGSHSAMTSFEADVADSFPRPPARHTSDDEFHVERLLLNVGHGSQRLLGERTTYRTDANSNIQQTDGTRAGFLDSAQFGTICYGSGYIVVFTLKRSFYSTTSAVPPVYCLILQQRDSHSVWSHRERKTKP